MPSGDHTGPLGQGPRTGRAAGYCAGYDVPGYMNPVPGGYRGYGRGYGRGGGWGYGHGGRRGGWGRGWGRSAWHPYPVPVDAPLPTREQELSMLQNDLRCLEQSAEQLRRRINELNASETSSERENT